VNIDAEIHEKVMGLKGQAPAYSTDIAEAWKVMEHLCKSELDCVTGNANDGASQLSFAIFPGKNIWVCDFWSADGTIFGRGEAEKAPLAICKAALQTFERK
jgi:hypothetical protein